MSQNTYNQKKEETKKMNLSNLFWYGVPALIGIALIVLSQVIQF